MSSVRKELSAAYAPANRFDKFGSVVERLRIRGFRGHTNTSIEFSHPVMAFSGPNGSGKSTVLEIAACCYKNAAGSTYHIPDFIPAGELDRAPFAPDASVEVAYCQKAPNPEKNPQALTISRSAADSRWKGYDRRPEKHVLFLGHGRHLPRSERRDLLRDMAENGKLMGSKELPKVVRECASQVLAREYTTLNEAALSRDSDGAQAIMVERKGVGCAYSELQMGCGEARVLSLSLALETAPDKSLILLEEPESAVHFAAQGRLGHYFLDVALRKGHQILLTTHSEHLLRTLPMPSRVYLEPTAEGVVTIPGLTSGQAASLMSDGFDAAITIFVEDECAKHILQQLLRRFEPSLLRSANIVVGGYTDDDGNVIGSGVANIRNAMATLRNAKVKVAAVVDGNESANPSAFVFKLPGKGAPEEELFGSPAVQAMWAKQYPPLDVAAFLTTLKGIDIHQWFSHLARQVKVDPTFLVGEAARAYAEGITGAEPTTLIAQLKDTVSKA